MPHENGALDGNLRRKHSIGRQFWVVVHRWAGLSIALFLVVTGLTGAILPWREELVFLSRPSLARVAPPARDARPLDGITLVEHVERQTGKVVSWIPLDPPHDHVAIISVEPKPGEALSYDTVWVDPYSGTIRLKFKDGELGEGAQAIPSFLYSLHRDLALGAVGAYTLGVAALIWVIDCFVGFYLTLPIRRRLCVARPQEAPDWWLRWKPAWLVRWYGGKHKLTFDLHRAGGLWLWPMLLVFAWSSFSLNLRELHAPIMRALGASEATALPTRSEPILDPPMDRREAVAQGLRLIRELEASREFTFIKPTDLYYDAGSGSYWLNGRSSLDVMPVKSATAIWFSAVDGKLLVFDPPTGKTTADALSIWANILHLGLAFGVPYRVFVSALGVIVVGLSVSGILIWIKKRTARLLGMRKRRPN